MCDSDSVFRVGSISNVVKKAGKEKIVAAYNECFESRQFATEEQREAERMAQELEVIAKKIG